MTNHKEDPPSKFHTIQAGRDLEANWEVDLAKKLEEYLLKICSGEITGTQDDSATTSINFAEAALLLQGSVQVYSRKVEYLYNLVLHALEFLTQNRQDQSEGTTDQPEQSRSRAVPNEENEQFWGLDDIPVEARNCLDASTSKDASFYHFVKPPANLVVLEGDCLDTTGDEGELESYLLATTDLYRDFILLDPCDTIAVNNFLKGDETGKWQNSTYRGSTARKSFLSPTRRSGGPAAKSPCGENLEANLNKSPMANCSFGVPDPAAYDNFEDGNQGFDMDDRFSEPGNLEDSDDDKDDPWKPLNPHEPGRLKVKPFKKVKAFRKNGVNCSKQISITTLFPLARIHGPISPELTKIWEAQRDRFERHAESQSSSLYEELRHSLANVGHSTHDTFTATESGNDDYDGGSPDFEPPDEMPENMFMDEDLPFHNDKPENDGVNFDTNKTFEQEDPCSQASLEDLCRSHLDQLLANIAESEKQTELAARVSSWKQKIESNLEEQDSRPPFDIHAYGERIIEKLSVEADSENVLSFADVVSGQEKHDVARTFSALLQLVNNGDVDLDRSGAGESFCYSAANPFHVRLLSHDRRHKEVQFRLSKKRVKSPLRKTYKGQKDKVARQRSPTPNSHPRNGSSVLSPQTNGKFSSKLGKINGVRCTPEGKRRRRSQIVEPVDLR